MHVAGPTLRTEDPSLAAPNSEEIRQWGLLLLLLRLAVLILLLLLLRRTNARVPGPGDDQYRTRAGRAVADMKPCGCAAPATTGMSAPVLLAVWVHV